MKIFSTLNIGNFHVNYCEDFLINEQIASHERLIAVMDGCTMGAESAFASMLYGKILRRIAKDKFYQEFIEKEPFNQKGQLKDILKELVRETNRIKNQLGLETNELLSTLIIGVVNTENFNGEFLAVGDGMIYVDGEIFEYEQNDKPDYIGYHLNEDFEEWYQVQNQKLSIPRFDHLSICTDGIYTFKNFKNPKNQMTENEIIQFLLANDTKEDHDNFLEQNVRYLSEEKDHVLTDDLAIISVKRH